MPVAARNLRMRPLPVLLIAALLAFVAPAVRAREPAPPVPLLWKVSDADNALYLLGSFHLLRPEDYPLSPDIDRALQDAETVLFEVQPDDMGSPRAGQVMLMAALRRDGGTLDGELPAGLAERLDAWLATRSERMAAQGIAPETLQRMDAWFVGLIVAQQQLSEAGMQPELGLDRHLAGRAAEAGRPAGGLETLEQVIGALDGLSQPVQHQMLSESLDEAQGGEASRLHASWRRGDLSALEAEAREMHRRYPELYRRINVERNDAWLQQLRRRLDGPGTDDTLVVVGALHLAGPDGLLARLKTAGYRVERICSACGEVGGK